MRFFRPVLAMKYSHFFVTSAFTLLLAAMTVVGCSSDDAALLSDLSGYVIVSTATTGPATGPGLASVFDSDGNLDMVIQDGFAGGTAYPSGTAYLGNAVVAVYEEVNESLEKINLLTGDVVSISDPNITANPIRQLAGDSEGSVYITESNLNTVEKIDSDGDRVGNPYIATTTGSCVLASPWGIAHDTDNNRIAVISSAASGRFSLYNSDGTCNTHTTAAPFNSGTPTAICYHALSGKFIVTFSTSHAIFSVSATGGSGTQIYLNSSIINTPRSVGCASDGSIYVGSDGTDTVEKLSYDGTGVATRALPGPFAGPGIYTQNPTSVTVIP